MAQIDIYTTMLCPFCFRAKKLLDAKGVDYNEIDVTMNRAQRNAMMERAGGRHTVPQIFIGETHVGGSDELYALESAGKLDSLLEAQKT
ncbi:MAG: glutaredoxin 3 [Rhodovibrionaceae bacterium]|nr:glutaredoxin 3 [Rhodovibrionaceae bacterium]